MRCPKLEELPPPPAHKTGWPWIKTDCPDTGMNAPRAPLPKISIIGLSFNQSRFLEKSIRSVLLQNYGCIEYMIIDGGSTDGSVEIIKKYEPWLAYWGSEKDRGTSHAINKGLTRATGQILCWLASDDYYYSPDTFSTVGRALADGSGHYALAGHCLRVHDDGTPPALLRGHYHNRRRLLQFWKGYQMHAPAIFWRREAFEKAGLFDESIRYTNDFDYWARIARHFRFLNVDRVLACATYHDAATTGDDYAGYRRELKTNARRYWPSFWMPERWWLELSFFHHFTRRELKHRLMARFPARFAKK
jgi:glycosyltransferase involved in cell wall biosynthesis